MPKFITSIRLQEASEKDYDILSSELKKYFFSPVTDSKTNKSGGSNPSFTFNSTRHKSLLDTTTAVSNAAASTGKKFSFTVIKEKTKLESGGL
jgi:hypothetical protein